MTFFSVWESEFEDTMSHLGAFATEKVPFQVGAVPFDARIVGVWEGNTSKALGGYRQRIEFQNDTWHDLHFVGTKGPFSEENCRLKIVQPRLLLPKECCLNIFSATFSVTLQQSVIGPVAFSGICHVRIVSMPISRWWVRLWMLDSAWTAQRIPASLISKSCQKEAVVTYLRWIQCIFFCS